MILLLLIVHCAPIFITIVIDSFHVKRHDLMSMFMSNFDRAKNKIRNSENRKNSLKKVKIGAFFLSNNCGQLKFTFNLI